MSDTTQPITTTNLPAPVQSMREQLPALLEKNLPLLQKRSLKADAALDLITTVDSDEEIEDAIAVLAAVRDVYNAQYEMRKEMTDITDSFKDIIMEYERPFNPDAKAKNKYNDKKKIIEAAQQRKHDRIQAEKAEAAKRKEMENHKVDLKTKMLENLNAMVAASIKRVDGGSKDFFAASTVETFDERAETYKKQKPKLKQADYDSCFQVTFNMDLIKPDEVAILVTEVKVEQTYDIWNNAFVEAISPVINEWRAKIPDLKKQLLAVEELRKQDSQKADELKAQQEAEAKKQQEQRQAQLDQAVAEQNQKIQDDASVQKMSNSFAEQAVTQTAGDVGRTKLVMKFTDPKKAPTGFLKIIYECMAHPDFMSKFPGFQKRDSKNKLMVDDKNRPVYIEAVQWWIDFWIANCDSVIEGATLYEDAKVTVRKS